MTRCFAVYQLCRYNDEQMDGRTKEFETNTGALQNVPCMHQVDSWVYRQSDKQIRKQVKRNRTSDKKYEVASRTRRQKKSLVDVHSNIFRQIDKSIKRDGNTSKQTTNRHRKWRQRKGMFKGRQTDELTPYHLCNNNYSIVCDWARKLDGARGTSKAVFLE